jgi:hypothetical protein
MAGPFRGSPVSRKPKRRSRPARRPARETAATFQAEPIWVGLDGRRMFVVGWTSGGAPYGVYEDEIDAGLDNLDAHECDEPY